MKLNIFELLSLIDDVETKIQQLKDYVSKVIDKEEPNLLDLYPEWRKDYKD